MKTKQPISIDWLWDRNIPHARLFKILQDPSHPQFYSLSALLLSRKNSPKEIFSIYLRPRAFCDHWRDIKREMRKNRWNDPRIIFWQAVYENLAEKFPKRNRSKQTLPTPERPHLLLSKAIGEKLKELRKAKALSQRDIAKKLHVSQQCISHIESGRGNLSLRTLQKMAEHLNAHLTIDITE